MKNAVRDEILTRLDAEDLIRFKSVCKSWNFLISQPLFVKAQHKKQVNMIPYHMGVTPSYLSTFGSEYYMVGSSNGLVCINRFDGGEIVVANPWTREERRLQTPDFPMIQLWGFGFDALTEDYKVVCGSVQRSAEAGEQKLALVFYVLSLKSNDWKHVGHLDYSAYGDVQIGTLFNGSLQWVMHSGNKKHWLISFDLSQEVFEEIHCSENEIRQSSLSAVRETNVFFYDVLDLDGGKAKYTYKLSWRNNPATSMRNFYTVSFARKVPYAFIPSPVLPSLVSPYLQEAVFREDKWSMLDELITGIEIDRQGLQTKQKKLIMDIKENAGQGSVKIMAEDFIRTRKQLKKLCELESELQGVRLRIQTLKATQVMGEAMKGVPKAMSQMKQMNLPSFRKIMEKMEMESEIMGDAVGDLLEEDEEEGEIEELVKQVLDEFGIEINQELMSAPSGVGPQAEVPATDDGENARE